MVRKRPLERTISSFLIGIVKVAVAVRAERQDRERRDREFRNAERRRKDLFLAQQRERDRIAELDREVAAWHKSQLTRAYVERVRTLALEKYGAIEPSSESGEWISWAMAQADRYNPLVESLPSMLNEALR